ncbi:MAG: TonB-dependent receptor [Verrucomicrobia subdivision 3 bacterium]|nr:TonB-dependent receptor [Limisphaerales bacterium]
MGGEISRTALALTAVYRKAGPSPLRCIAGLAGLAVIFAVCQRVEAAEAAPGTAVILAVHGDVEVLPSGARNWIFISTQREKNVLRSGDQLRTGRHSHAKVRLADRTVTTIAAEGHLRVLEPLPREMTLLEVVKGLLFFLHRDTPGRVRVRTATVTAAIEGTEFSLQVAEADGATRLDLIDGKVTLANAAGQLSLTSGQASVTEPGEAPVRAAMLAGVNVIQWILYYPAVLNLEELPLPESASAVLGASLEAYRRGDLLAARAQYPENRSPDSSAETVYLAALSLAVGEVEQAAGFLNSLDAPAADNHTTRLAAALHLLIAAVKFQSRPSMWNAEPATSSEWLAESYYEQSRGHLDAARMAARQAVAKAPDFAFALARLAELEFSFGRVAAAEEVLQRGLALAPENAQAVALQGFLYAARNQNDRAIASFDRAIELDSGLANAWLGRGLCRIRRGEVAEGREDLLVAAATEPHRSVLRSYLAKAFTDAHDHVLARHELALARRLDENDPTAWLYSALLDQLDNRVNDAIENLEHSQWLNQNRAVYRSRLLLDQDRAVRGVNLANIYSDAGLTDVAFREGVRAVYDDYSNFSTHLFLANSFNRLRDPRQVHLRYESPWLNEYLVANLLAPVGAGTLSQLVSTEEYSRLFERNRLGLVSATEYLSNGDWLQAAAQYGRLEKWNYAVEEFYRSQTGFRRNGDLEQLTLSFQTRIQLGPQDDLFLQAVYYDAEGGDLAQHYSETDVNEGLRFEETQEPILVAGYHHAWTPGSHTLFVATRLDDTLTLTNPDQGILSFGFDGTGQMLDAGFGPQMLNYRSELEIYTAELQQIWEQGDHRWIVGGRYQGGAFDTFDALSGDVVIASTSANFETSFDRQSIYAYHHWHLLEPLRLIGGVSYDRLNYPENFRSPPISGRQDTVDQVSPKAGLIWTPTASTTIRAAYARSLGGVSIDQSFQLEPSQVAGFVQTYRSLIPESVRGQAAATRYDSLGLAWDQKFPSRTYVGVSGEWLESKATRQEGVFLVFNQPPEIPSTTPQKLEFQEKTLRLMLNQLVGEEWAFGAGYRLSHADLEDTFTSVGDVSTFGGFARRQHEEATLHQVYLLATWNSPSGFFARFDSVFSSQDNDGYSPERPGDDFWQFHLFAGYRFAQRRAELSAGVLNLTDQDYRLNPLNLTPELPRERTLALRVRFAF